MTINPTQRITAARTLSGFIYRMKSGINLDQWNIRPAELIIYELRAEGFSKNAINSQFANAHLCVEDNTMADQFVLSIAAGLAAKCHTT